MDANRTEAEIRIEPRVAVVGLGGAGCNVIDAFYKALAPVDTIAINTDRNALDETAADKKIYICKAVTMGKGTNGDAGLGRKCARIHEAEIEKEIVGHDIVFLITGLGGGTGTGATSVAAEICSRHDIMTFTIGINPFSFETSKIPVAREGLRQIRAVCPNTFTIENDKILDIMPDATMSEALNAVNRTMIPFVDETVAKIVLETKNETAAVRTKYTRRDSSEKIPEIRVRSGIRIIT